MSKQISDKDAAFLKALIENDGEASVGQIREYTEENADVVELGNSGINYRCRRLGQDGTNSVDGKGYVEVRPGGLDEDGRPNPKLVEVVDTDTVKSLIAVWEDDNAASVGNFESVEEAFVHLLDDVEDLKEQSRQREQTIQQLTREFRLSVGELREVVLDEHGVDIADAAEDAFAGGSE